MGAKATKIGSLEKHPAYFQYLDVDRSIYTMTIISNVVENTVYRVFQKFVPIVNCILRKAFKASLGKCKLIKVRNLSK